VKTSQAPPTSADQDEASPAVVLREIRRMVEEILGEDWLEDVEITMDTRFNDDLELESIDLVALAGRLEARYGSRVNFAEFIADLDLDEVIGLTVGRLVDDVAGRLRCGETGSQGPAIRDGKR
jgi:acyl carrier protein